MGDSVEVRFAARIPEGQMSTWLERDFRFERRSLGRWSHPSILYAFQRDDTDRNITARDKKYPTKTSLVLEENFGNEDFHELMVGLTMGGWREFGGNVALEYFEEIIVAIVAGQLVIPSYGSSGLLSLKERRRIEQRWAEFNTSR